MLKRFFRFLTRPSTSASVLSLLVVGVVVGVGGILAFDYSMHADVYDTDLWAITEAQIRAIHA